MFYQVFVERVRDLQPTDEYSGSHIIIAIIYQSHLALEITNLMFEALSGRHLDKEEVITILLKLPS